MATGRNQLFRWQGLNREGQPVTYEGITFQEVMQAEKEEDEGKKERETAQKTTMQESQALEAIGKFNRTEPSMAMAEKAGPDAWATAPKESLQQIAEGQVLNEMYGGPMGLARGQGITSNISAPAKQFMSGLEKEQKGEGKLKFQSQMKQDTPESKSNAMDILDRLQTSGQYPNVNWDAWKNRITDSYDGAYQFNKIFTGGQTTTDEAVRKENLIRPAKAATSAATSAAGTSAKMRTEKAEGKILPATASEKLGDFVASMSQMNELLTGIKNPDSPQGPISQWKKANPYDWKAQGKQQLVASTKQLVGKALEGGVLRKEDEEKYNKILPKMGDTYESAELKSKQLMTMLNNAYMAKRQSYEMATYDVSRYPKSLNQETKIINGVTYEKRDDGKWHRK